MFWGLIMEPGRCYTQTVKCSFHVSMASLDISNSGDEPVQVMCVFDGRNYLLCTLNKKDKILDKPLDLTFKAGTKVSFATNGKGHVHLTGYLVSMMDDDDIFDEEDDDEYVPVKEKKRSKKNATDGPPKKKTKNMINSTDEDEEQEEEEGEEEEDSSSALDSDELEEEDGIEDEEEDDDEEEEEEDTSSLSSGEAEEQPVKLKQNGVAKSASPKKKNEVPKEKVKKPEEKKEKPKPKKAVLKGGVIVEDLKEGNGEPVKPGKVIHVYYEGRFKSNNKLFDSTNKGPGFSFRVGKGEVIKGWDFGVVGMKVGGKRRITCPPKVAYGPEGSPPVIPPNSTLVFDIEVKKIS